MIGAYLVSLNNKDGPIGNGIDTYIRVGQQQPGMYLITLLCISITVCVYAIRHF